MPAGAYSVSGDTATDVNGDGGYTLTVTGTGNYKGTATAGWNIAPRDISGATVYLEQDTLTYKADGNGAGVEQSAVVKEASLDAGRLVLGASDYDVSGGTGTDAGGYSLVLTGKGNYTGATAGTAWEIGPASLPAARLAAIKLSLPAGGYVYDGQPKEPGVDESTLPAGVSAADCSLSYADNVDASAKSAGAGKKATATLSLSGNWAASNAVSIEFNIAQAAISDENTKVVLDETSFTYDGQPHNPSVVKAVRGDVQLSAGADYEASAAAQTDAGDYTASVSGKGNYTGTATAAWSIEAADGSLDGVGLSDAGSQVYDGTEKKPAVTGLDGLAEGTDYDVSYKNNVNAGTATATVTLKGNRTGTKSIDFQVKPYTLSADNATLAFANDNAAYTGSEIKAGEATLELKAALPGGAKKLAASDFSLTGATSATDAGAYSAWATGTGNFAGTVEGGWTIAPVAADASKISVSLDTTSYTYDGGAHEPAATVAYDGTTLSAADYDLSYTDNTNAGTAKATVTLKGNYSAASAEAGFTIDPADLSSAEVVLDGAQLVWTGSEQTKKVSKVILDGKVLDASADYTVAGNTGTAVGAGYSLTVSGKGNYTGTSSAASWSIAAAAADSAKLSVALDYAECTYDATEKQPGAAVTYDDAALPASDYDVSYSNNTNAGTATATVTLKGNLTGSASATFSIKPLDVSEATLTFAADGTAYTGSAIQAGDATLTLKEPIGTAASPVKAVPAASFAVVGATSGTNAGAYSAWAAASGNYTGVCAGTWTIAQADMPDSMKPSGLATVAETGQKLSEVALPSLPDGYPGTLEWKDGGSTAVSSSAGTYSYTAVFTSSDANYKPAEVKVSTKVSAVYKVVYHANGGTLSSGTGEGDDAYGSATYSQKIYLGSKNQTLTANAFTAPSGTRFAFWTLGTPDTELTSAASTVTAGAKNVTTLTYVDGHDLSKVDGNAENSSAKAVEMYTDASTSTSKTQAGAGATVNLYAHWIDESLGSYWMAPSKKCTTSNKASSASADVAAATAANADYSSPEAGDAGAADVYKDNAAVKSAVADLKAEIAAGVETTRQDEWTALMQADKYHLYTLYREDRPLAFDERYVESRVVQVGAHGGDGTTLTFEMVHALPTAYFMNSKSTNAGGWEACELRATLSEGGAAYANFEQGYLDDVLAVGKYTIGGKDDTTVDETSDKLWLLSYNEITGSTDSIYYEGDHGGQYGWYKALSVGTGNNSALVNGHYTRSEGFAASASSSNTRTYLMERSPVSTSAGSFAHVHGDEGKVRSDCIGAGYLFVVHPAFSM